MRIDVTTTYSIKDDDGREVTRVVAKAHTSTFSLEDESPAVLKRIQHAASHCTARARAATDSILATLRA